MYYALLGLSLVLGIFRKYRYSKEIYCVTMFVALFLVSGLRVGVGYDFNPYTQTFYNSYTSQLEEFLMSSTEKGYLLLNEIISSFTPNYQWLFIIIAFIVAATVMWFIYRYSKNVYLSTFAFLAFSCFYFSMDFMRQIFAGVIMMFAFKKIDDNDYLYYILLVLFASCFHKSAFLMLPLLLVLKVPINKITFGIGMFLLAFVFLFSEPLIQLVLSKGYYTIYVLSNVHMTTGIPLIYGIVVLTIFFLAFLFRKKLIQTRKFNRVLIAVAYLNALFTIIGVKHSIISRFTVLLEIPVIVILLVDCVCIMVEECKSPNLKKAVIPCFILLLLSYHAYLQHNNYNGVFPYRMIGSEQNEDK